MLNAGVLCAQCYDKYMLEDLRKEALKAGDEDWCAARPVQCRAKPVRSSDALIVGYVRKPVLHLCGACSPSLTGSCGEELLPEWC